MFLHNQADVSKHAHVLQHSDVSNLTGTSISWHKMFIIIIQMFPNIYTDVCNDHMEVS